eukprot:scaffold6966_cov112-Cylindrotheca_fusiformis.AAC.28
MSNTSSNTVNVDKVLELLEQYPLVLEPSKHQYGYGTAGFRFKVEHMASIMVRVGIISAYLFDDDNNESNDMGVMITASHNDESYNGVKLSNPDGSMIPSHLETILVQWVNERNMDLWKNHLLQSTTTTTTTKKKILHVGYDTRSHSPRLADLLIQGAKALNIVTIQNHGILTTPMLHHIVLHSNAMKYLPKDIIPICPTRNGYIQSMAKAYLDLIHALNSTKSSSSSSLPVLLVDCACGVGYEALQQVVKQIIITNSGNIIKTTKILPWNPPGDGSLNINCGSEHVQKQLQPPIWYNNNNNNNNKNDDGNDDTTQVLPSNQEYCCSIDGDADRIVFFSTTTTDSSSNNKSTKLDCLLDGDKIAVLIGRFLKEQITKAYNDSNLNHDNDNNKITMGIVQTAYANGASTNYIQNELNIPVVITKTGVKYLHHAALKFDVGIYFEANGHGTVESICPALTILPRLINPAVGDAISDLLLVDALLQHYYYGWTLYKWNTALYTDLPSRQLKVNVHDRSIVQCNDNETKCITPITLQPALDELIMAEQQKKKNSCRTFCRASGTENVVRVYAEAPTREDADRIATMAASIVYDHCGGVGPKSSI